MNIEKRFMSVKELQTELGISHVTAYQLVRKEGFPTIRVGKRILIPQDAFNEWVQQKMTEGKTK